MKPSSRNNRKWNQKQKQLIMKFFFSFKKTTLLTICSALQWLQNYTPWRAKSSKNTWQKAISILISNKLLVWLITIEWTLHHMFFVDFAPGTWLNLWRSAKSTGADNYCVLCENCVSHFSTNFAVVLDRSLIWDMIIVYKLAISINNWKFLIISSSLETASWTHFNNVFFPCNKVYKIEVTSIIKSVTLCMIWRRDLYYKISKSCRQHIVIDCNAAVLFEDIIETWHWM